jgi:hypothetical protein
VIFPLVLPSGREAAIQAVRVALQFPDADHLHAAVCLLREACGDYTTLWRAYIGAFRLAYADGIAKGTYMAEIYGPPVLQPWI